MMDLAFPAAVFTAIVTCLVLIILAARSMLVATGEVDVTVNDGTIITAAVGQKLLGALVDAGIRVPSACGGIGSCGQCRVQVLEGGGVVLPTEASRITRRDLAGHVRLACQVMIRQPLTIRVPDEILGVKEFECTVRSSRSVGALIKELVLELPAGEVLQFRAGAFVQVTCPPFRARFSDFDIEPRFRGEWTRLNLWRYEATADESTTRAYSMANTPDETGIIILIVRVAIPPPGLPDSVPPGIVSSYLFSVTPGDKVLISGPFGNFFAADGEMEMIFVGGGAGMAPMRALILDQLEGRQTRRKITFWYGARSRQELFYVEDFDRLQRQHDNFRWVVALSEPKPEDAWQGEEGFIHEVLYKRYLESHPAPEDCEYYLCGPPMMIKAVLKLLDRLGVDRENIRFDDFSGG